ncbi:MAG: hypothetical protein WBM39_09340, partial [Parasphingorhabdus sp.]
LLQIFLLGQPEFRDMLESSDKLEQLRQRVIAHHHLDPMSAEEIEPYITHRLSKSGWSGRPKITTNVFRLLYAETEGVPRKINTLMSRVLLMGSVEHAELIDQTMVERVLADLNGEDVEIDAPLESSTERKSPLWEKPKKARDTDTEQQPETSSSFSEQPLEEPVEQPLEQPTEHPFESSSEPVPEQEHEVVNLWNQASPEEIAAPSPAVDDATVQSIEKFSRRLSVLEERMDGQEENMHRVLTMLVEWVENDIRSKESYVNAGRAA